MFKDRYELTIDKILTSSIRNNPNQIISYKGDRSITYSEFKREVYELAGGLVKQGLRKGDRVAVLDWDTLNYLKLYYAVPIAGGVLHTVNIRYSPELIFYTMQHAEDKFVVIRDEFIPLIERSLSLFDFVKTWIVSSDHEKPMNTIPGSIFLNDIKVKQPEGILPVLNEEDIATTFYTSGTTGLPKGVLFTHRQIVMHTLAAAASLGDEPIGLRNVDVIMPLVPMFHVHSWGAPYFSILKGMKYVLPGRYDFEKLPGIMAREGVSVSLMVPSILYLLISSPEAAKTLSKLNLRVTIGGGALPKGLAEKAGTLGIKVAVGYGMSETAPILTLGTLTSEAMRLGDSASDAIRLKTGVPMPLVDMKVVDKNFVEVPWDGKSIGEIVVRAPWLTKEYVKDEENTRKLWKNDWLNTGDLAVVDELGYINIVDREKDAVKSGGEFIPTIILEDAISTFPGVAEVAVIGKKDEKWGERPVAFISGLKSIDRKKIEEHLMGYVK
ncbi:MAG: long-chain-fatty-acid--CoA ligase, partial [Thermoplasmataceae archaeon]